MRRIDIPVSEIGRHYQSFLLLMKALREMTCFSAGLHCLWMSSFGKNRIH